MNLDAVINVAMGMVMMLLLFSMGLALTVADFKRVTLMPLTVTLGLVAQMVLLPLAAFLVARALGVPDAVAVGMMLVAICPSGATSNFFTYLSGGELALSMTLNATVTLLCLATLPAFFTFTFLAAYAVGAETPSLYIIKTMLVGLVAPAALGMVIRAWKPAFAGRVAKYTEKAGTWLILVVLALLIFKSRGVLGETAGRLVAVVLALNVSGMAAGYGLGALFGRSLAVRKTFTFEVGMQNIQLAVVLAMGLFAPDPQLLSVVLAVIAVYAVVSVSTALCCVYFFKRMPSGAGAPAAAAENAA